MKFYRGVIDVGKPPVRHHVQRGFLPMTINGDNKPVPVEGATPIRPMSAAEVTVIRNLFGQESVTKLAEVGENPSLSFAAERDRLETVYGDKVIERLFGPRGVKASLPRELEYDEAYFDQFEGAAPSSDEYPPTVEAA
jgi:hypothetical protein